MTASSYCVDAASFRRWFATKHRLGPQVCVECGNDCDAVEFIHARKRSDRNSWQGWVRDRCAACRHRNISANQLERRKAALSRRLTIDLLSAAERILYPSVRYHDLTSGERLHAYWLARTWWFDTGFHEVLKGFDADEERARLRAVRAQLERRGFACVIHPSPIPPDADDQPHH